MELSFQGSRSSDVLWLVDGIRINNRLYSTTTPLDTLPAHLVERIEVLEGGESLFYGTQSVAGTINIATKQFSDKPEGQIELGGDSNEGKHLNGFFRTAVGEHRFAAFASKDKADGFQPFSDEDYQPSSTDRERGYDVTNYGLKYAYDFGTAVRTSFGYQHTDATLDYARPSNIASASNDRDEDLLTAKVDIASGEHLQLYIKGYYHDWDTLYNEVDNVAGGGTEVISDNEFWGFEDYGANLLAKFTPGGALEYLAGWDYQHYSGEDQVFLIAPAGRDGERAIRAGSHQCGLESQPAPVTGCALQQAGQRPVRHGVAGHRTLGHLTRPVCADQLRHGVPAAGCLRVVRDRSLLRTGQPQPQARAQQVPEPVDRRTRWIG